MPESKINPHEIAARWKERGFSFGVFCSGFCKNKMIS